MYEAIGLKNIEWYRFLIIIQIYSAARPKILLTKTLKNNYKPRKIHVLKFVYRSFVIFAKT